MSETSRAPHRRGASTLRAAGDNPARSAVLQRSGSAVITEAALPEPQPTGFAGHRGLIALIALLAFVGVAAGVAWVVIILVLVATLFMHELGHYLTARATGMKVTEFFVGFGPRIWSFKRGETAYGIKAIWAGAYVRIIGMNNLDHVEAADESRSFRSKSYPRKLVVLVAGSAMHFVMAVAFLFAVLVMDSSIVAGGADNSTEVHDWTLATVSTQSAASDGGLQPGDQLVSVAGVERTTFADFSTQVAELRGQQVEVIYQRGSELRATTMRIGERLTDEGAATIEGLFGGDRILGVEGLDVEGPPSYSEVSRHVGNRLGEPLDVAFVDGRTGATGVVSGAVFHSIISPSQAVRGFFGVSADYHHPGLGVLAATGESLRLFGVLVREVVFSLPMVVTEGLFGTFDGLLGNDSATPNATQPLEAGTRSTQTTTIDESRVLSIFGVARIGAAAVSDGATEILLLLAFVNVFIGVFNLIPLLPLDGGHVAVATYERLRSLRGRVHEVDARNLMPVTYAVVVLLLLIGGVALVRDIVDPFSFG